MSAHLELLSICKAQSLAYYLLRSIQKIMAAHRLEGNHKHDPLVIWPVHVICLSPSWAARSKIHHKAWASLLSMANYLSVLRKRERDA